MARGKASKVGDTNISANGYHYTKTASGWELTHRIVARRKLGRDLLPNERIRFADGKRTNLRSANLIIYSVGEVRPNRAAYLRRRIAALEVRLEELKAELIIAEKLDLTQSLID